MTNHTAAFEKLGLAAVEKRYSCTWDYDYNTNALAYKPRKPVTMQRLQKYLEKNKYRLISTNSALLYETEGKRSTFRCHYYRRDKFDFFTIFTRQYKGDEESVTSAEYHFERAAEPPKPVRRRLLKTEAPKQAIKPERRRLKAKVTPKLKAETAKPKLKVKAKTTAKAKPKLKAKRSR